MTPKRLWKYLLLFLSLFSLTLRAEETLTRNIDWPIFMSRQDMIWEVMPKAWYEAPFLGNGLLGAMVYQLPGENTICFDIGRSDVHDHRDGTGLYDIPRLLIGKMALRPHGRIIATSMRLDLWNAELTGKLTTTEGAIRFRALVHSERMCLVVETLAEGNERDYRYEWLPAKADSPRFLFAEDGKSWFQNPVDYQSNPSPVMTLSADGGECQQPLLKGGLTVTNWRERRAGEPSRRTLYLNVSHSYPDSEATAQSRQEVSAACTQTYDSLRVSHCRWWNEYYPQSFLTLPDPQKENFYWVQMYKLASATRADRALIDNTGPWLTVTPWPNAWWNLNVQLTYWALNTSNRLELAQSLEKAIYNNTEHLINNVEPSYRHDAAGIGRTSNLLCQSDRVGIPGVSKAAEVGLLTWACHNLWLIYRHRMDDVLLREKLFPLLRRSINYYLHFLTTSADGRLHLPRTYSPEYGVATDCNFDLALLRWGCQTLLTAAERLNLNDSLIPVWESTLKQLTDYPIDENGLRIGSDTPYEHSHRHYSHLLAAYPLYLLNKENPADEALIQKSLLYWQSKKGHHEGYSMTGASSISSALGKGDQALDYLNGLFGQFLCPNTFYKEAGPCIETPLSGAQSIHDMLLQSWGGKIRIFPALPSVWKELAFDRFLTEGAFEVSAVRKEGQTAFICITSLAGEPCIVCTDIASPQFKGSRTFRVQSLGNSTYRIDMKKGETLYIYPQKAQPTFIIEPVAHLQSNVFGLKQTK
ncbi:MAG: alpha-L-fucosidase [Bacteroides sp.]|uniref:glycosyl hydrolase family 95 catalytic domain-containing protein n=1 Tax=Bacteroides sp. TaxID=29523 RepID=UPI002FCC0C07